MSLIALIACFRFGGDSPKEPRMTTTHDIPNRRPALALALAMRARIAVDL